MDRRRVVVIYETTFVRDGTRFPVFEKAAEP